MSSPLYSYLTPPTAAGFAILFAFPDMAAKSAIQIGEAVPKGFVANLKGGAKAAPTVGLIVGTQMILQGKVESLFGENKSNFFAMMVSSAIVGSSSSPFLAVYNGQTMNKSPWDSLKTMNRKQLGAITLQETAFVAGIKAADFVAPLFGEGKLAGYLGAFTSGAMGCFMGHPANTILTRSQKNLTVDTFRQYWLGVGRRTRGGGIFSVMYRLGKEILGNGNDPKAKGVDHD